MEKPVISIIIPVFNVENILPQCINSVLAQSFRHYEILLIDDGSTDGSGIICDIFSENDNRIHSFHQPNQGASSARNLGLLKAQGEYIVFIDSDDMVQENYLYDLYSEVLVQSQGLVIQGFVRLNQHGDEEFKLSFKNELLFPQNFGRAFLHHRIHRYGCPVAKIFSAEVIKKNSICFDPNIHLSEDKLFVLDYIQHSAYLRFSDKTNYRYLTYSNNSLTTKKYYDPDKYFFKKYLNVLFNLQKVFSIENADLADAFNDCCSALFTRTYYSMYRPQFFIDIKNRMRLLRTSSAKERDLVKIFYSPVDIPDKISKYLFVKNLFHTFDLYNYTIFNLRYIFYWLWPVIRYLLFQQAKYYFAPQPKRNLV